MLSFHELKGEKISFTLDFQSFLAAKFHPEKRRLKTPMIQKQGEMR